MHSYTQLTEAERNQIYALKQAGFIVGASLNDYELSFRAKRGIFCPAAVWDFSLRSK